MSLFSNFCNICYKIDNGSLKDISEENMKHLNDILYRFVGHADIIKHNVIYACQLCCEELIRFDKFREMCFSNLIQMRQRYINIKLELEGDDACAIKNTLQKFVYEEVLRKSSIEDSNCSVSISTGCHDIKSPVFVNKGCLVFNRQVTNLQLETNECEFDVTCSEVSSINSVTECDESRVAVTYEENMKNEMLRRSEYTKLEKFEAESDGDIDVFDTNNDNKCITSQIEFVKVEYDLQNEIEDSDSENYTMKNYENESDDRAGFIVKMLAVNKSEGSVNLRIESTKEQLHMKQENSSECLKVETREDEFGDCLNVDTEIANFCTVVDMEDHGQRNIRSDDANNKLTVAAIDAQPHVRESNNSTSEIVQSDKETFTPSFNLTAHERVHSGGSSYKCTFCNKTVTHLRNLIKHERTHSGARPYKCTVCDKTFADSSNLISHKRIHSGIRPYRCTVCNKTFTQSSNLTRHERIHSGVRPYKCTVCYKTFKQPHHLIGHTRIHTDERPYKCTVCNKTFTQSSNLTVHERIHSADRS